LGIFRCANGGSSATIVADGKRFSHQINTDEVFGTHNGRPNAEKQILGFKPAVPTANPKLLTATAKSADTRSR